MHFLAVKGGVHWELNQLTSLSSVSPHARALEINDKAEVSTSEKGLYLMDIGNACMQHEVKVRHGDF